MGADRKVRDEDRRQARLLGGGFGKPSAGRDRYAAAMYFYQRGLLSERCLEVYRTCSVIDGEDPRPVLAALGLLAEVEAIERADPKGRSGDGKENLSSASKGRRR
jgi:hypothetical protein